jgi:environmental stress-induced protein Ves
MRILRRDDCPVQPWKNGGGVSRLVAAAPEGAGYDALDWHVSRPAIAASGPFSHLPGLDRQFMLVAGRGVILHCRGDGADFAQRVDAPLVPFAFRGDWDVRCELIDGPVEVFNVMTRRGRVAALVSVVTLAGAPAVARKAPGEVLIAHCPSGPVTAYGSWGTARLERDDAVIADEPAATEVAFAAGDAASLPIVIIRVSAA